jgi:RES domain/Shedu protein SduA, C-terminal
MSHTKLQRARDEFRDLLDRPTAEGKWQKFFADNPYVLSRSLPVKVLPCDIVPLGRPGKSEPDFVIYPRSPSSLNIHGLIELKTNETKIFTKPRKNIITFSGTATTAIAQLLQYEQASELYYPVTQAISMASRSELFMIMGVSAQIARYESEFNEQVKALLRDRIRLLTFDELLHNFEKSIPKPMTVLIPDQRLLQLSNGSTIERLAKEAPVREFRGLVYRVVVKRNLTTTLRRYTRNKAFLERHVNKVSLLERYRVRRPSGHFVSHFSPDGRIHPIYAAFDLDAAISERRYWVDSLVRSQLKLDKDFQFQEIILTLNASLHDARLACRAKPKLLDALDYSMSNELARRIFERGSDGLIYPSVRSSGEMVAIFRPSCISDVQEGRALTI